MIGHQLLLFLNAAGSSFPTKKNDGMRTAGSSSVRPRDGVHLKKNLLLSRATFSVFPKMHLVSRPLAQNLKKHVKSRGSRTSAIWVHYLRKCGYLVQNLQKSLFPDGSKNTCRASQSPGKWFLCTQTLPNCDFQDSARWCLDFPRRPQPPPRLLLEIRGIHVFNGNPCI